jgi:hypothetical protein
MINWQSVYHADVAEAETRNGVFVAELRGFPLIKVKSPNAEYDLLAAMVAAGLPDGPIQFWVGCTPSLLFHSVHRAAGFRIELGENCPHRLVRRRSGENFKNSRCGGPPGRPSADPEYGTVESDALPVLASTATGLEGSGK